MHDGLTGQRADVTNTLIKYTGPRFFSLMLPGYTAYILVRKYGNDDLSFKRSNH